MRWLLLGMIHLYWWVKPLLKPRTCLFHESCSRHVYRIGREQGLLAGIQSFRLRIAQCRDGFSLSSDTEGNWYCVLADGSQIPIQEMSTAFIPSFLTIARSNGPH